MIWKYCCFGMSSMSVVWKTYAGPEAKVRERAVRMPLQSGNRLEKKKKKNTHTEEKQWIKEEPTAWNPRKQPKKRQREGFLGGKRWQWPWCWEKLKAGGERDNRGWDGWMASPTEWIWVLVKSGSWWWTGRPSVLWSMGSQRVRHGWVTDWTDAEKKPNRKLLIPLFTKNIFIEHLSCIGHFSGLCWHWMEHNLYSHVY